MSSYTGTFKRIEIKYQLEKSQRLALESALVRHMQIDSYGRTLISSMYWDTPTLELAERGLDKPLYKEKVRLRRYGVRMEVDNHPCFVELKKKYRGVVYKRRMEMTSLGAHLMLLGKPYKEASTLFPLTSYTNTQGRSRQIAREIEAFCSRWSPLSPSMLIECQRTAWQLRQDSPDSETQLRITFDDELRYRDLRKEGDRHRSVSLLDPSQSVLEIKAVGTMPRWLPDALDAASIRPSSFTKYGRAYRDCMQDR